MGRRKEVPDSERPTPRPLSRRVPAARRPNRRDWYDPLGGPSSGDGCEAHEGAQPRVLGQRDGRSVNATNDGNANPAGTAQTIAVGRDT
jgi:hypothetical protein